MRRWRVPLLLSAIVVAALLAHTTPLIDVVTGQSPAGVSLTYPFMHVVLAPYTLLADWLNAESRQNITGFVVWLALGYVLWRLALGARGPSRELAVGTAFVLGVVVLFALVAFVDRPIPRLVVDRAAHPDALVWDSHSHTQASHDGRDGFSPAKNLAWHALAGFDAAFITDHNVMAYWPPAQPTAIPRLSGEELSLYGLHLVVLGNTEALAAAPYSHQWDSTLARIRGLAPADSARGDTDTLLMIASLPEYWQHHWGDDLRELAMAGVKGFEVWTSSPGGMAIPDAQRATVIARARLSNLVPVGATDMHGYGLTASVWNVTDLPGWRQLDDRGLEQALIAHLARGGFAANRVIALRRAGPSSRIGQAIAVPVGLFYMLRRASLAHGAALLAWIWLLALLSRPRPRRPTPTP